MILGATSLDKAYVQRYLKLIEPKGEESGASEDEEASDNLPTESDESDSDSRSSKKKSCTSFTSNLYDCPMTHLLANHHPKRTRDDSDVRSPRGGSDGSDTDSGSDSSTDGPTYKRRRL